MNPRNKRHGSSLITKDSVAIKDNPTNCYGCECFKLPWPGKVHRVSKFSVESLLSRISGETTKEDGIEVKIL